MLFRALTFISWLFKIVWKHFSTRENSLELPQGRFKLDFGNDFFTGRVGGQALQGAAGRVGITILEVLKSHVDVAFGDTD